MPVRGLTIIVAEASSERFRVALSIAAAQAALGGTARIFCQGEAVSMLGPPIRGTADGNYEKAGQPRLADLFEEVLGLDVAVIACQSGIDLTDIDARTLDPRITIGGLVGMMQASGDDRLLVV